MSLSAETFPPPSLQDALAQSALRGTFTDTAYFLYSHRALTGKIGKPRIIYGNSLVMNAAGQYFRGQLSTAFSQSPDIPLEIDADEYGYQSDSDLEDEWDVDDTQSATSSTSSSNKGKAKTEDDQDASSSKLSTPTPAVSVERTVFISDVAAVTWEALLFYIYTGKIHFAPLRSEGIAQRINAIKQNKRDHPHRPLLSSPKSIYRLADKIGLNALKSLAAAEIKRKSNSKTILNELFSRFSSRFPDIMKAHVDFFFDNAALNAPLMLALQQKIRSIVKGDMPHADNALMSLLERIPDLSLSRDIPSTPPELQPLKDIQSLSPTPATEMAVTPPPSTSITGVPARRRPR